MADKIVKNLTAKRLKIYGSNDSLLVLAPLEKGLKLAQEKLEPFDLDPLELQNIVTVQDISETINFESKATSIATIFFWFIILYLFFGFNLTKSNPQLYPWYWIVGVVVVLIVLGSAIFIAMDSEKRLVILRLLAQFLSLLLILTISIGFPTLAIYFFGGGREFFRGEPTLALFGRALQLIFIVAASLLPALLYFLFDRQQLGTLRERFEQQIFRLDPNVKSITEVTAKYGRQLSEIYGSGTDTDEGRLIRVNRWPILVATLVITLGWILTLLPVEAELVVNHPNEILNLFFPQHTTITFGFLGVYFFALNSISRRYIRADLKPKAYSSITVRIFIVTILAWVIGLFFKDGSLYALTIVFLIGIFPESGLTLIQESIRKQTGLGKFIPSANERHPLTNLEEIDVYDRARLLDEGVTNIESLAHHDMIDLMLETRIPVPRLVDWIDQAILYLHLTDYDKEEANGKSKQGEKDLPVMYQLLRGYGIRTATDLMKACKKGNGSLCDILSKDKITLNRLKVLLNVLKDDEWLNYICHWRDNSHIAEQIIKAPSKGEKQTLSASDSAHHEEVAVTTASSASDLKNTEDNGN